MTLPHILHCKRCTCGFRDLGDRPIRKGPLPVPYRCAECGLPFLSENRKEPYETVMWVEVGRVEDWLKERGEER